MLLILSESTTALPAGCSQMSCLADCLLPYAAAPSLHNAVRIIFDGTLAHKQQIGFLQHPHLASLQQPTGAFFPRPRAPRNSDLQQLPLRYIGSMTEAVFVDLDASQ